MHDLDIAICKLEIDVVAIFNVYGMAEETLNLHQETESVVIAYKALQKRLKALFG